MNSLIQVIKISKAKSSAGRISQRFNRMCARLWPKRRIWSKDSYCFLTSMFAFILFVILQNPSKIIWLTCIWSKFVDTNSFFAKPATKSFRTGPPFLPNLKKVVTRMDTSILVGHLMFITQRYTILTRIYWPGELLEKWGNQSKRQLCREKSWIQGLAPKYGD